MKYAFIRDALLRHDGLTLNRLLVLVQVSTNGYYEWLRRKPCKRLVENKHLIMRLLKFTGDIAVYTVIVVCMSN